MQVLLAFVIVQYSLYPVLKVCSALYSGQRHLLITQKLCDLASQLFCSPIRLLHGGKTRTTNITYKA
ncbi:hypothetical protein Peur_032264 [Populus x canadensis]